VATQQAGLEILTAFCHLHFAQFHQAGHVAKVSFCTAINSVCMQYERSIISIKVFFKTSAAAARKKRKEKTTPFGVYLMRSQVLHRAAQKLQQQPYYIYIVIYTIINNGPIICLSIRICPTNMQTVSTKHNVSSVLLQPITAKNHLKITGHV